MSAGFAKQRTWSRNSLKNDYGGARAATVWYINLNHKNNRQKVEPHPETEGEMRPVFRCRRTTGNRTKSKWKICLARAIELSKDLVKTVQPGAKKAWEPEKDRITDLPGTYPIADTDAM